MHSILLFQSSHYHCRSGHIACREHKPNYICEKQVLVYFIPFMSFVNLVIVFCLERFCQCWVRTRTHRSRPIGYLAWLYIEVGLQATRPARKCRHINVPIWGSDSISDWLNAPPLMTCGAFQSNVFFTSSKQTRFVFTSIENCNSSLMYF